MAKYIKKGDKFIKRQIVDTTITVEDLRRSLEADKTLIEQKNKQLEELQRMKDRIATNIQDLNKELRRLQKDALEFEARLDEIINLEEDKEIEL